MPEKLKYKVGDIVYIELLEDSYLKNGLAKIRHIRLGKPIGNYQRHDKTGVIICDYGVYYLEEYWFRGNNEKRNLPAIVRKEEIRKATQDESDRHYLKKFWDA